MEEHITKQSTQSKAKHHMYKRRSIIFTHATIKQVDEKDWHHGDKDDTDDALGCCWQHLQVGLHKIHYTAEAKHVTDCYHEKFVRVCLNFLVVGVSAARVSIVGVVVVMVVMVMIVVIVMVMLVVIYNWHVNPRHIIMSVDKRNQSR